MGIKLSDLTSFVNKEVTIQVDTSSAPVEDDYYEVTGRVLAATPQGVVVRTKTGTHIIEPHSLLDVEEIVKNTPRRLIKRWIKDTEVTIARQHLIDRHGMPIDLVHALTDETALDLHSKIDHNPLGHGHGTKPPGKRGRKPRVAPPEGEQATAEITEPDLVDEEADE